MMNLSLLLVAWIPADALPKKQAALLYTVTEESEAVITGGGIGETEIVIPATIGGYPVAGIEVDAFRGRDIETVVLQNGIRYIKEGAFAGCEQLKKVEFAEGLLYIGNNAFESDSRLQGVLVPESVVYIGEMAFGNCIELVEIKFPKAAHVDAHAFEGSAWQKERDMGKFMIRGNCLVFAEWDGTNVLEIPYGITEILRCNHPKYGTEACKIILPNTVVKLDNGCFGEIWIDEINIPSGVKEIPAFAFENSILNSIILTEGVESIGMRAFRQCTLNEIELPNTLKAIDYGAFEECVGLQKITIPGSVRSISSQPIEHAENKIEEKSDDEETYYSLGEYTSEQQLREYISTWFSEEVFDYLMNMCFVMHGVTKDEDVN